MILTVGGNYNWKGQNDKLVYLGKLGSWHQFRKIGDRKPVWCEVLDECLYLLEATPPAADTMPATVPPEQAKGLELPTGIPCPLCGVELLQYEVSMVGTCVRCDAEIHEEDEHGHR